VPDVAYSLRCQRCGTMMDLRDPAPGAAWTPQQFWVCSRCGRHFWTTYPSATPAPPKEEKPAAEKAPAPAAAAS
jgi:DNA-directed RNA polymerase subunit RPC12/RpoP